MPDDSKDPTRVPHAGSSRLKVAVLMLALLSLTIVACYFLWAWTIVCQGCYLAQYGNRPVPMFTEWCIEYRWVILWWPGLWLAGGAAMVIRDRTSPFALTAFASTLIMTLLSSAIC